MKPHEKMAVTSGIRTWLRSLCENRYLYFPDARVHTTPASMQIAYDDVFFPAVDGISLHGWYLPGRQGMPVVLFCHGNAGNIADRVRMLAFLNARGVSTLIFDYRGYGRSGGRASEEGTYNDARGALSWLRAMGWQRDNMIYLGRSLGAAVALHLAIEQPPARLVLECPFTSIEAMGRLHHPILYRLMRGLVGARYDNWTKIAQLQVPLMLCHGTADNIVPVTMGEELYERAKVPKQLILLEGGGHSDALLHGNRLYASAWQNFSDMQKDPLAFPARQIILQDASGAANNQTAKDSLSIQNG